MDQSILSVVQGVAAIFQVITAIVIVLLTHRLAATAEGALRASESQAHAAARSVDEIRRQGQLGVIPLLSLEKPSYVFSGELSVILFLANESNAAALGVAIAIFAERGPDDPELNSRVTRSKIPLVSPGGQQIVTVDGHELQSFGHRDETGVPKPMFTNDWLMIVIECSGLLGARVRQRYEWHANFANQEEPSTWRMLDVAYSPDGAPESEIVVRP